MPNLSKGCIRRILLVAFSASLALAQTVNSAYRALGQVDLRHNAVNLVQGTELYGPSAIALDPRGGQVHVYIADARNSRILAWQDLSSYQTGDRASLVLGQPDFQVTIPLGIGDKGLNTPAGLAVDPANGNLYVADTGNNRVVRFASPFSNPTRVEPDAVYGQADFAGHNANAGGISAGSMKGPKAVAFDAAGNLWVADSGNNRILRFPAAVLDSITPPGADTVIGQKDFQNGGANHGGSLGASGFDLPDGLAFDGQNNLYVSDFNNARVLKFAAPLGRDPAASAVYGQAAFTTRGAPPQPSAQSLAGPAGLAIDRTGRLYVADPNDNRVLIFPAGAVAGASAIDLLGQADFVSNLPNSNLAPRASASSLAGPSGVQVTSDGGVVIADSQNNRVLFFPAASKTATRVWGQSDFTATGANQIKASSINAPFKMAIDYSQSPFALYVSDTNNHRVLVWKDAVRFRSGDPAELVIGQPDFHTAIANVDTRGSTVPSATSLSSPRGIAVDQAGNLYVADSGNNRVLRFPRPVAQAGRIAADVVIGQANFSTANSASVAAASLKSPGAVAIGPGGELFVADSGNNRVLQFAARAVTGAAAFRVYGQANFESFTSPSSVSAQTLSSPQGLCVDPGNTLYVSDSGANRVLVFPAVQNAPASGASAGFVLGQTGFASLGGAKTSFRTPVDVALDSTGEIYVSDNGNNRVLVFPPLVDLILSGSTPVASRVIGQKDLNGTAKNWNSTDNLATPEGLYGPLGIYLDRKDTLYVGDAGNNRVLHFLKPVTAVNAANYQGSAPLAPGGLVTVFGGGMADRTEAASNVPWPLSLADREVVIDDDTRAPLLYVGSGQANFQIPSDLSAGTARVAIRATDTGELIAGAKALIAASSPGLFTLSQDGKGQGAALNQDGGINGSSNPAARGSVLVLFGTGQGQVSPPVPDGTAAPSAPLSSTVAVPTTDGTSCINNQPAICAAIGGSFGDIQFSGLAPSFVGLWQINVRIPQDVPVGNAVPVRVVINGVPSNTVTVAIK